MTVSLIDPPTPFDNLETWEAFISRWEEKEQDDDSVKDVLRYARRIVSEKKREAEESAKIAG